MKVIVRLLIVGVVVILAAKLFRWQEKTGANVISRLKTRDPEQVVIALALTVGLGLVAVVAGQALGTLARKA